MIRIRTLATSPVMTNTYILTFFNRDAIVIDPGGNKAAIDAALAEENAVCRAVLLTHAHFDHIGAVAALQKDGATVYMHADDVHTLEHANMAELCGTEIALFRPDVLFTEDTQTEICGQSVRFLHTPGHTPGGVCYIVGGALFSGDTLFCCSVGRTDFPGGDAATLTRSICDKLFTLKCDYPVYPGHDRTTTLFFEKENNPYV